MPFLKTNFVNGWLKDNFDVCFITETHMTKGQMFTLESFVPFHNASSEPGCKHPRGGISCFIQNSFMENIKDVDRDTENFIILSVGGLHTLFGTYIPPSDSLYFDETLFATLSNRFQPIGFNQ